MEQTSQRRVSDLPESYVCCVKECSKKATKVTIISLSDNEYKRFFLFVCDEHFYYSEPFEIKEGIKAIEAPDNFSVSNKW
jgi:hypothetical protein